MLDEGGVESSFTGYAQCAWEVQPEQTGALGIAADAHTQPVEKGVATANTLSLEQAGCYCRAQTQMRITTTVVEHRNNNEVRHNTCTRGRYTFECTPKKNKPKLRSATDGRKCTSKDKCRRLREKHQHLDWSWCTKNKHPHTASVAKKVEWHGDTMQNARNATPTDREQ